MSPESVKFAAMKIAIVGTGYVGLVTGACFAETGNDVICVDTDERKIGALREGKIPFYEPSLAELVCQNASEGRLRFTTQMSEAVAGAKIGFICVGTPSSDDGSADLSWVNGAGREIAEATQGKIVLTVKSTVPIGTCDRLEEELRKLGFSEIQVVSNPEFLREGSAVQDCLLPDRVVVGTENEEIASLFRELYHPFVRTGHPIFVIDRRSTEMTKYASNALLACRISFMNEMAVLCEEVGADVSRVRSAMGADHRIGMQYLFPSVGFGGSCFPKDVRALEYLSRSYKLDPQMLTATLGINEAQKKRFVTRMVSRLGQDGNAKGKQVAIWGLAFKAKTDDVRESPALTIVEGLLKAGVKITVYDPEAMKNVREIYGEKLNYAASSQEALKGADALCVLTEWNQFRHPDFSQIKTLLRAPLIFDGRNLYDPEALAKQGFEYHSIGR